MQQQQENTTAMEHADELKAPYMNTLGFKIIQSHGDETLPDDVKAEVAALIKTVGAMNPDDVQSAVVVVRTKAANPETGEDGFHLTVAALGSNDLAMGSSMMLNEHLVNTMGGVGALLAAVLGTQRRDETQGEEGGLNVAVVGMAGTMPDLQVVVDNTAMPGTVEERQVGGDEANKH